MTPGDYANDDTTIFQRGPGTAVNRFTKDKRLKTSWVEPVVGTHELEPVVFDRCMGFTIDKENNDILCGTCRGAVTMDEIESCTLRPTHASIAPPILRTITSVHLPHWRPGSPYYSLQPD